MKPTSPIVSEILPRSDLGAARTEEMFALLNRHFDGVTRDQFADDLAEKNRVILLHRKSALVGFSTLLAYESRFDGLPVSVLCSGDTIVEPEAWGTSALPRAWIAAVNALRTEFPQGRYYWLLLTSGFRTYRFLPVFWRGFFPCFDHAFPCDLIRLRNQLASESFGDQFDPEKGIVRFHRPQRLRPDLADVPPNRKSDPHVVHFLQANPGHAAGDELVCLTELSPANLTAAGRRMVAPSRHGLVGLAR
jgi:hypothetical protein